MVKSPFDTKEFGKLMLLIGVFVLLVIPFYYLSLGQYAWDILLFCAVIWFVLESKDTKKSIANALKIGAFLLVFDFIAENTGWIYGLWQTHSMLALGVVPVQVMGIAFFGGAAWALYLPKEYRFWHSVADTLAFAFFGALGEYLLIRQGLFAYHLWWTSAAAFSAYYLTWIILHFVRYKVFKD